MTSEPTVAAVFNTSRDIVDLLRHALEPAGIVTVSAMTHEIRDGAVDVSAFLAAHGPDVVVYDIAPPYDANWRLFQHVCRLPAMRDRPIVLTAVNRRHVEHLAGSNTRIYEVVGKPLDLDEIVTAVRHAARSRPTR